MKKGILVFPVGIFLCLSIWIQPLAAGSVKKEGRISERSETVKLSFDNQRNIREKINQTPIYYTPDNGKTFGKKYAAVRIGEYYWMDSYLNEETQSTTPITKAQIDSVHSRYTMFHFDNPETPEYWEYGVNLEHFIEHYGTTYTNGIRNVITENSKMCEGDSKSLKEWRVPLIRDCQQLAGMCGDAKWQDGLKYLVWGYDDPNAPSFARFTAPGYWFHGNSIEDPNTNKYGFNWVAAGWRAHADGVIMHTVDRWNQKVQYELKKGDLIGYNQVAAIFTAEKAKFILNEDIRIQYQEDFSWSPIRMCRPLTDEELGYKLYINQKVTEYMVKEGWQADDSPWGYNDWTQRMMTVDNILVEKINQKQLDPENVQIIKKDINESCPTDFIELPRGFIRGMYVQHILDNPQPEKTVVDILRIATGKRFLWVTGSREPVGGLSIDETNKNDISYRIYPNPVIDKIYFEPEQNIASIRIYNETGQLVVSQNNDVNSVDMSQHPSGVYFLRFEVDNNIHTRKIIKK